MNNEKFTIGKLAISGGVGVETIRFYERKGLIKQPQKNGGYREYPKEYISRVQFLKKSQELGFTLKEAKELLDLKLVSHTRCSDVLFKTERKIDEIDQKIRYLKKMKRSLKNLANCCEDKSIPLNDCSVLDGFIEAK